MQPECGGSGWKDSWVFKINVYIIMWKSFIRKSGERFRNRVLRKNKEGNSREWLKFLTFPVTKWRISKFHTLVCLFGHPTVFTEAQFNCPKSKQKSVIKEKEGYILHDKGYYRETLLPVLIGKLLYGRLGDASRWRLFLWSRKVHNCRAVQISIDWWPFSVHDCRDKANLRNHQNHGY